MEHSQKYLWPGADVALLIIEEQITMPARLNRRRYREIVTTLKEVIADPKATRMQRLRAVETLIGVYDRHDRSEAAKGTRKKAVDAPETDGQPEPSADAPERPRETAEEVAQRLIEHYRQKGTTIEQ